MIVAHCGQEANVATAVVASASSAPVVLALFRARLGEWFDRVRGRR